ncbi:MAG TPA: maleylpyruvate isomerase N-terminal domain-containing protein [Candidatus Limnocylindria bacterium]|nr:maleylpyruvate isomerase N-terminal domain-containing protein [Candidatus Limnocylindria bacterium]
MADRDALLAELHAARDEFSAALEYADPVLLEAPGLVGDWNARQLVAHLAHWDEWASTCLEAVAGDGLETIVRPDWDVDAQNAAVAARALERPFGKILDEEAAAFERFAGLLAEIDPELLGRPAPWGGTVETIVRENGPDHYSEHAAHLRAWFGASDDEDGEDDEDDDDHEDEQDDAAG